MRIEWLSQSCVNDSSPAFLDKTEQDKERNESSQPEMALLSSVFLHEEYLYSAQTLH